MSQQGIAAIETGDSLRPRKIRELARAVGKSEAWLLGESSDATPPPAPNASFPPSFRNFSGGQLPLLGQTAAGGMAAST